MQYILPHSHIYYIHLKTPVTSIVTHICICAHSNIRILSLTRTCTRTCSTQVSTQTHIPYTHTYWYAHTFIPGTHNNVMVRRIPRFKGGESVIRLSLGRRLVNLSPVAQRTNAFHKWRRRQTMGRWSWVRISRPPWKRFLKKSVFPHVKNLMNSSPWVPRDYKRTSE